jgi:hypothetical protein
MRRRSLRLPGLLLFSAAACNPEAPPKPTETLTFEFTTEEVTNPDVAVSPDGKSLLFTLVGHLFQVSTNGGDAEQLTFGLGYDFDPVFSPDGTRLAFVSDREGTEGNLFVLELSTGEVRQLTAEPFGVARPAWSHDGTRIVYLDLQPPTREPFVHLPSHYPSILKVVEAGAVERRGPDGSFENPASPAFDAEPRFYTSAFFLEDGRLGFSEILPTDRFSWGDAPVTTRVVAVDEDGAEEVVVTAPGILHRVSPTPDGFAFLARHIPDAHPGGGGYAEEFLALVPRGGEDPPRHLTNLRGTVGWDWGAAVGVDPRSGEAFFGKRGQLVAWSPEDGGLSRIPFEASVRHTAYRPAEPIPWDPPMLEDARVRDLGTPRPLPGGRGALVLAAGQLWRIPEEGGAPERIHGECCAITVAEPSPDGQRVALVVQFGRLALLKLLNLGDTAAVEVHRGAGFEDLGWTDDGTGLVFRERGSEGWTLLDLESSTLRGAPDPPTVEDFAEDPGEAGESQYLEEPRFRFDTPPPTLIRRVRILDFEAGGFGEETSILVRDGRIHSISEDAQAAAPPGAVVLDAGGRFLVPGFIDLHWHFYGLWAGDLLMFHGVTSVREVGNGSEQIARSLLPADLGDFHPGLFPRVFYAEFYGRPARLQEHPVSGIRDLGGSWAKSYATLPWAAQAEVAESARAVDIPVSGHGWHTREVVKGATLGFATLEHAGFEWYDDLVQLTRNTGTAWVPTLGNMLMDGLVSLDEPERRSGPFIEAFGLEVESLDEVENNPHGRLSLLREVAPDLRASIRRAYLGGVPVLVGTDIAGRGSQPGQATLWEIRHLVDAGIPPVDAIRAATLDAARLLGADAHLGSIEEGKLADLVILDANPLEDIRNTTRIWRVMKGGWMVDPDRVVARMQGPRN